MHRIQLREAKSFDRSLYKNGKVVEQKSDILDELKRKTEKLKDRLKFSEPKQYTEKSEQLYKAYLSPDNLKPSVETRELESQVVGDSKDVSVIRSENGIQNESFYRKTQIEPEKIMKANYEVRDAHIEPIAVKDEARHRSHNRNVIDNLYVTFSQKTVEHKGRNDPNVIITQPNIVSTNHNSDTYTEENVEKVANKTDHQYQGVANGLIQKQPQELVSFDADRKQVIPKQSSLQADNQAPNTKRQPFQSTETHKLISQRLRRYTMSNSQSILKYSKKWMAKNLTSNYKYTQPIQEKTTESESQDQLKQKTEMISNLQHELNQKDKEMETLKASIESQNEEIQRLKDQVETVTLEKSNAISDYRKAAERVDELNGQLDAARYRLQTTSDKFGKLIDYLYRMNNSDYLNVLEEIVGVKGRNDLDDVYKKYEGLKRKMAEITDLVYMSKDRSLIDKLEQLEENKGNFMYPQ